jgi:hypothetical protein
VKPGAPSIIRTHEQSNHLLCRRSQRRGLRSPSLTLAEPEPRAAAGRALAQIDVSDEVRDCQIPLTSKAQVAIYKEHLHDLSPLRKILLRMKSWGNYAFLEEP